MALVTFDLRELSRQCGEEVPEIMAVIAKHEVLDIESKTIAELLGVTQEEIDELKKDQLYQKVLLLLRAAVSQARVETEIGYDALEQIAVNKLLERVQLERDGDFLLKVAAMANRATRRTKGPEPLDPSKHGIRVPLTLTQRFVRKANNQTGEAEEIEEREISINGKSHSNPSFDDVNKLLNVTTTPFMDQKVKIETKTVEPSADDLMNLI